MLTLLRYLLSLLTSINLPEGKNEFFETLKLYFPNIYDVKYLMKSCKNLKGGLQEVADMLEVDRIGPQHQAGSDSLLTGRAFFKMTEIYFEDGLDDSKYLGHLYGLGTNHAGNCVSSESAAKTEATWRNWEKCFSVLKNSWQILLKTNESLKKKFKKIDFKFKVNWI